MSRPARKRKQRDDPVYTDASDDDILSTTESEDHKAVRRPSDCGLTWLPEEDYYLNYLVTTLGPRWGLIAEQLPGRTHSMARNRFARIHRRAPDGCNKCHHCGVPKTGHTCWALTLTIGSEDMSCHAVPTAKRLRDQKPKLKQVQKAEAWLERQPEGAWMQTFLYFTDDL